MSSQDTITSQQVFGGAVPLRPPCAVPSMTTHIATNIVMGSDVESASVKTR